MTLETDFLDRRPSRADLVAACRGVRILVGEMYRLVAGELPPGVEKRRALCHLRQIAMYVCHVVLRLSFTEIGIAYGRDRTTVGHACKVIEDRRDDRAYDDFVSSIERCAVALFQPLGGRPNAG